MALQSKSFGGLNRKRIESRKGGNYFPRCKLKKGSTVTVQFLGQTDNPKFFTEFENHSFQESGRWKYVPCIEDECPLCSEEDPEVSKTSYRFCAVVYDHDDKQVAILEGPTDLAERIMGRYEKLVARSGEKAWLRKVWDVTKFDKTPISHDIESVDQAPKNPKTLKVDFTPQDYIKSQLSSYYGADTPAKAEKSESKGDSLDDWDDDWDDDGDDDGDFTEDELKAMSRRELSEAAREVGIKASPDKITKANRMKLIDKF